MTRDEAIRWFTDTRAGGLAFRDKQVVEASNMAITALQEQEKFRWIPVTEELPEQYSAVIVCTRNKDVGEAAYDGSRFHWTVDEEYADATHWMPLPEPPREG